MTNPRIDTVDIDDLNLFLYPRIDFPRSVLLNDKISEVTFTFRILTDGSVDSIRIIKSNSDAVRDELVRVLSESSGKWTPASKNGHAVISNVKYSISPGLYWKKKKARRFLHKAKKKESRSKYNKAIKYYQKLLILIPDNAETVCDIAKNYFLLGDKKNACKTLDSCTFRECTELKSQKCNTK